MPKIKKEPGFTLIELLVVISIVGILAALALTSYGGAQKQTRDTQRRSDLSQYRIALENFSAANDGLYPSHATEELVSANLCTGSGGDLDGPGLISACPIDPLSGSLSCDTETCDYRYASDGSGGGTVDATIYVLSAPLETGGWWVVCSTGQTGKSTSNPADENCPL